MPRISSSSHVSHHSSVRSAPTHYHSAPSMKQAARGGHSLTLGHKGPAIKELQQKLNAAGANLRPDGKFGPSTDKALRTFQEQHHLSVDGKAGPKTLQAFRATKDHYVNPSSHANHNPVNATDHKSNVSTSSHKTNHVVNPRHGLHNAPANGHATFDRVVFRGKTNQRVDGRVTINGHTYKFRDGGKGWGNAPKGDYKVTPHRHFRKDAGYSVNGFGYSFMMERKDGHKMGDDKSYDPRTHRTRTYLRIHPDGGSPGTHGCMGIVGDVATQKRFRADMEAEIRRHGGSFTMHFGQ